MEDMAHEILHRYRTDKRKSGPIGLIAVTMNMRNHGDREVDPQANKTWKNGNENHAYVPILMLRNISMNAKLDSMDLVSMISGSAQDFKLVLDYLPTYFPQFTRFYNIMFGVSLGGHTAWRIASLTSPGQFHAYAMVVGCPSLSTLLLSRLGIDPTIGNSPGEPFDYEKLRQAMNSTQQKRWPRALAEIVNQDDQQVTDEFPDDVPLLLCNGKYDKLVPAKYTAAWVEERQKRSGGKQDITFFVQDNTGHSCTKEMVAMTAEWLRDILPSSSPQPVL
ncbi:hypothetical protein N7513_009698 [Penicillium frequentans]|nr:hypothetical protein N7513_009698 [Penicillium glabrum]